MDKIIGLIADGISLAVVLGLVIYIWRTHGSRTEKDHVAEERQRKEHDDILLELITKLENRNDRDFEKLFKAVSCNTENIRQLTADLSNFKEVCEIKRQSCQVKQ